MGQSESRDREFFTNITKHTLKEKGNEVSTSQLTDFLQFTQTVSPWFPRRRTMDVDTWDKVGLDIQNWFTENEGLGTPFTAFATWNVLRKALADEKKAVCAQETVDSHPCEGELLESGSEKNIYSSTEKSERSSSGEGSGESEEERSTSEEESDSEKTLMKPHKHKWSTMQHLNINHSTRPPGKLKKKPKEPVRFSAAAAARQAQRQGESLSCFPVITQDDGDGENPLREPLPFKLIKEIKQATSTYGPILIFVESLTSQWKTSYDWFQVAKTCLDGENFLLWKVEYEDLVLKELVPIPQTSGKKRRETVTYDMLPGLGE